ncbi:TraX family protein [Anaerolentibacter hominis]|uniref:TraX family protein n=1 Tax=Anaerolentibacter hominis TaxID=3079009 RepID=UPI0031B816FA
MSSTALKLTALVLMLIDHIGEFIPGIPVWFRWLGRLSAPVFLFCMVWGLAYTHDKKRYLSRMYFFGVIMAVGNLILNSTVPHPYTYLFNNIFVTLFLVGVVVELIELLKKDWKKGILGWVCFILFQVVSTIVCIFLAQIPLFSGRLARTAAALLPNLTLCEGGVIVVLMGVLLYYTKKNKKILALSYLLYCAAFFFLSCGTDFSYSNLFLLNYQWMMVFALPFMLAYNGKKGRGMKYLFYIFYPAHIFVLFLLGSFLNR